MTTQEVANRLVELGRIGQFDQAAELHADHVTQTEPDHVTGGIRTIEGKAAVKENAAKFHSMIKEMHGGHVGDPTVEGKYFSLQMGMDVTMTDGKRMDMKELCMYKVEDGNIESDQIFY
jgi:hypothetical protein